MDEASNVRQKIKQAMVTNSVAGLPPEIFSLVIVMKSEPQPLWAAYKVERWNACKAIVTPWRGGWGGVHLEDPRPCRSQPNRDHHRRVTSLQYLGIRRSVNTFGEDPVESIWE